MASASSEAGPTPTDPPITQQGGNAEKSGAPHEDWPSLLLRCEDLDITAHTVGLDAKSFVAALAAIDAAKKSSTWKKGHRNKLRMTLQRAIAAASECSEHGAEHGAEPAAVSAAIIEPLPVVAAAAAAPPFEHYLYSGQARGLDDLELELELDMYGTRHRGIGVPQPLTCLEYYRAEREFQAVVQAGVSATFAHSRPARPCACGGAE
jgi:hypothetical protein